MSTEMPNECSRIKAVGIFFLRLFLLTAAYMSVEVSSYVLIHPQYNYGLIFGFLWSLVLACVCLLLPRLAGRIFFGISYYFIAAWAIAQSGYYQVFHKMMWLTTMLLAGEGAGYMGDVLPGFSPVWWGLFVLIFLIGGIVIWKFPKTSFRFRFRLFYLIPAVLAAAGMCLVPQLIFLRDNDVWGTHSEYGRSSSLEATYNTMYDAENVYDICGIYHLTFRDIWKNEIYPMMPQYRRVIRAQTQQIEDYFHKRGAHSDNEMTGILKGKNVVLVLMESMDDWLITPQDTPTLCRLMGEGLNFTHFYSPGYGSVRTLNTEFCMNTGMYLPTTGHYVFDYIGNSYQQSAANQLIANGYTAECFHYNSPAFYSRGVMEPAIGYRAYTSYEDFVSDPEQLYDECYLFKNQDLLNLFFREGQTFNTVITRSAHLSYVYNEVLSYRALKQYPEYRGKYASEEEDCARVKAKLVDDFFADLVAQLEQRGELDNTVIVGVTDHYTYGYKNMTELYAHSGVQEDLLLEKTPFFIWSQDGPSGEITKTLNTSDVLPTLLNLLGIDSPYSYLGQDAFDTNYVGYAIFPNGSWISQDLAVEPLPNGKPKILANPNNIQPTQEQFRQMQKYCQEYIEIGNLLLSSDYYK